MSKYGRRWEQMRQIERLTEVAKWKPAKVYWVVFNSRGGPMYVVKTKEEAEHEVSCFEGWSCAGPYVLDGTGMQHKTEGDNT